CVSTETDELDQEVLSGDEQQQRWPDEKDCDPPAERSDARTLLHCPADAQAREEKPDDRRIEEEVCEEISHVRARDAVCVPHGENDREADDRRSATRQECRQEN